MTEQGVSVPSSCLPQLVPLEEKVFQYEKLSSKLDEIYTEALGPFRELFDTLVSQAADSLPSQRSLPTTSLRLQ